MDKRFWRRQHKWFGIAVCFFMLMFCLSGIILNHRHMYSRVNVSRQLLPHYRYENWNSGLLRGTLRLDSAKVLIYGQGGVWLRADGAVTDFNQGLPDYADYRSMRRVMQMPDSTLFAAGQYELYRRSASDNQWHTVAVEPTRIANDKVGYQERYSDVASLGDTLLLLSRNRLMISLPPYNEFTVVPLATPDDYDGQVSLFRVVWLLHNAQIFGMPGRVVLDIMSLIIIIICITGIIYWICPTLLRRNWPGKRLLPKVIKGSYKWHKALGVYTIILISLIVITGWLLRPPLLIPIAMTDVPGIPGTPVAKERVWDDKLRAIRHDPQQHDWILSTSDGFYSLPEDLNGKPTRIAGAPHVSVMGVNVMEQEPDDKWIVGSLSGMWRWDRKTGKVVDYFDGTPMPEKPGAPFGKTPVAGYTKDFGSPTVVEYYNGTTAVEQPPELNNLPMSLWQFALEVHTGRMYHLFGLAPLIWIFVIGAATVWTLITGWKLRR